MSTLGFCAHCGRRNVIDATRLLCGECEHTLNGRAAAALDRRVCAGQGHEHCDPTWCHVAYAQEPER